MAQAILVDENILPGGEFVREFDRVIPVKVAFWAKEQERDEPYLFVASDQITDANLRDAIGEQLRIAGRVGGFGLDADRVTLLKGDDRRIADVLALRVDDPKRRTRPWGRSWIGGEMVEDLYVYPPLGQPAATA